MPALISATLRQQIDEFVASGRMTRLRTTDSRILPPRRRLDWDALTPRATADQVARATPSRSLPLTERSSDTWPPDDYVLTHLGPCAAEKGSKRELRYAKWRLGMTVLEMRTEGVRLTDLRRDRAAGRVVIAGPAGSREAEGPAPTIDPEDVI